MLPQASARESEVENSLVIDESIRDEISVQEI